MWKQVKKFDQSRATTQKGYCLRNVRTGYGIGPKYASAWDSWLNSTRRTTAIPDGVDVPVYFWWGQYGHVGVRLADGRFWSDGTIYSSLNLYRVTHPAVVYRGWSEEVNDVAVIKWVEPTYKMPPVGSKIKVTTTRTTFKPGTTVKAGTLRAPSTGWVYTVRGYDPVYKNRILINSASAGGDGVALALYYTNGTKIGGWTQL